MLLKDDDTVPPLGKVAGLVVVYGDELGKIYKPNTNSALIGRSSECDIRVDQESISRNHAKIVNTGKAVLVRDLGSTNGTYVNDLPIEEHVLHDGDHIKLGRTIFKFLSTDNIELTCHEEMCRLVIVNRSVQGAPSASERSTTTTMRRPENGHGEGGPKKRMAGFLPRRETEEEAVKQVGVRELRLGGRHVARAGVGVGPWTLAVAACVLGFGVGWGVGRYSAPTLPRTTYKFDDSDRRDPNLLSITAQGTFKADPREKTENGNLIRCRRQFTSDTPFEQTCTVIVAQTTSLDEPALSLDTEEYKVTELSPSRLVALNSAALCRNWWLVIDRIARKVQLHARNKPCSNTFMVFPERTETLQ